MKLLDTCIQVDGVKVTICAYRGPRKGEVTFDINKSKYTPWSRGVTNYVRGSRGCLGTVDRA